MNKKILAAALTAAMLVSVVTSCNNNNNSNSSNNSSTNQGGSSQSSNSSTGGDSSSGGGEVGSDLGFRLDPAGYPVMDEPVTVSAMGFCTIPEGVDAWESPNEIYYFAQQEARTNIHIEWDYMTDTALTEKIPILFAGDDLPDIFFKTDLTGANIGRYGGDGMLINLEPYLETYAPDLYELLSSRDQLKFMRYNNGIYGFPYYFESEGIRMTKIFVNQKWLDNLNLEIPTNWDQIHDVTVAFKEQDANGNGDPNDEQPWCFSSVAHVTNIFAAGKYNLMNRGTSVGYIQADPDDASGNTLETWITADEMKEVYRDVKQYWDEGLLSPNLFDTDYWSSVAKPALTQDKGGFFGSYVTAAADCTDNFVALPNAPSDTWNYVQGYLASLGSGLITKECDIPEAMVSWFNYLYTLDGAYEYFLGIEGESYIIDDDGHVQLTEKITNHPELEQEQAHLRYSYYSGGGNPALATNETFKGGETHIISLNGCDNFRPATKNLTIWEAFPLTSDQTERVNAVKGDIDAVYKEYRAAFITGTKDIDADWQEYLDRLDTAGLQEYLSVYQETYNMINS